MTKFENGKLKEFLSFIEKCKGEEPAMPILGQRMMHLAKYYEEYKEGLSPFVLGRDYRPSMKTFSIHKDPKPTTLEERETW